MLNKINTMKYFQTYESFKKDYMKKIDLSDFKKIKKGAKIKYMGGSVEVLNNNGYVLTLKGEDGKSFTVNKSQFDHGGFINEGMSKSAVKKQIKIIDKMIDDETGGDGEPLTSETLQDLERERERLEKLLKESVNEAKAPNANKAIKDLKRKGSEINWLDDANDDTKKIWKKAGVNPEDENTVILYSYVSHQWDDVKKILNQHNVEFKELEDPNSGGESFIVFVKESINELKTSPVSGTMAGFTTSLEDRKYELKKDAKGATIGSFSNVTLPKGTIIYNLPGGVFADHFSLKNKYSSRSSRGPQYFDKPTFKGIMIKQTPAVLSYIEKNSKVLESFDTEIHEGMTPAITFEFPDERKARQFDLDIENSAIGLGDQIGNKVTVTEVDTKWRSTVKKFLIKNKGKVVEESVVTEAVYIPSNIEEFAKRKGILPLVKKIGRWAEKAGKRINGGTAIGKYYDTLILDLRHHGGEIRVNIDTDEVKLHGTVVTDPKSFKKALKESINEAEFKHINKDEHEIKLAIKDVEKKARLKANRGKKPEYEQLSLNKIMLSKVLGREKLGKEHQDAWEKLKKEYSLKGS